LLCWALSLEAACWHWLTCGLTGPGARLFHGWICGWISIRNLI